MPGPDLAVDPHAAGRYERDEQAHLTPASKSPAESVISLLSYPSSLNPAAAVS
jgi:hypothetical protein